VVRSPGVADIACRTDPGTYSAFHREYARSDLRAGDTIEACAASGSKGVQDWLHPGCLRGL